LKLIYSTIASLDGFVADDDGDFRWAAPDEEVHAFINDLERPVGTYLYGRGMYEIMSYWETALAQPDPHDVTDDFAKLWLLADKIVFSTTLESVSTARTRLERKFDPELIRRMKAEAERDIGIGGPTLAAGAFAHGLVDEVHCFIVPVIVGSGKRSLPPDQLINLELLDQRRFEAGTVHLHYRVMP
jgi:dihydrofolate reductase